MARLLLRFFFRQTTDVYHRLIRGGYDPRTYIHSTPVIANAAEAEETKLPMLVHERLLPRHLRGFCEKPFARALYTALTKLSNSVYRPFITTVCVSLSLLLARDISPALMLHHSTEMLLGFH